QAGDILAREILLDPAAQLEEASAVRLDSCAFDSEVRSDPLVVALGVEPDDEADLIDLPLEDLRERVRDDAHGLLDDDLGVLIDELDQMKHQLLDEPFHVLFRAEWPRMEVRDSDARDTLLGDREGLESRQRVRPKRSDRREVRFHLRDGCTASAAGER